MSLATTKKHEPLSPHSRANSTRWLLWAYLLLIALAELCTWFVNLQVGHAFYLLILVGLIIHGSLDANSSTRGLALALALAPLIRILSLSLPLSKLPQLALYPATSGLLLIVTWLIIRQLRLSRNDLGLRFGNLALQLMLAGGGLALGFVEYHILTPRSLVATFSWQDVALATVILIVFTGFVEELIFRGVLQALAWRAMGLLGLTYISVLFAVLHIGYLSLLDFVFALAVGMLFAYIVQRSGSIFGVTLAHGITNVTLFLALPYLEQNPSLPAAAIFPQAMWVGASLAVVAILVMLLRSSRPPAAAPEVLQPIGGKEAFTAPSAPSSAGYTLVETRDSLRDPQPESLLDALAKLPDQRPPPHQAHYPQAGILGITVLATLHGQRSLRQVWSWSCTHWEQLAPRLINLDAARPTAIAPPPALEDIQRVMLDVDPTLLASILQTWAASLPGYDSEVWRFDQEVMQGSPEHTERILELLLLAGTMLRTNGVR